MKQDTHLTEAKQPQHLLFKATDQLPIGFPAHDLMSKTNDLIDLVILLQHLETHEEDREFNHEEL